MCTFRSSSPTNLNTTVCDLAAIYSASMEISGIIAFIFLFLVSLLTIALSLKHKHRSSKRRRPPGPWAFPLVGSIHHMLLTSQPQATLCDLAKKHGPVMYLRLGQIDTVVISSPAAAQEVLQASDHSFASRPTLIGPEIIFYGNLDIAFAPYGDYWRALRKLCTLQLLSARKVRQFAAIRDIQSMSLVEEIRIRSTPGVDNKQVNISRLIVSCTNSIAGLAIFGDGCSSERKEQFLSALAVLVSNSSGYHVADLFPSLWFADVLTGLTRRVRRAHRQLDELLNKIIVECEARWKERKVQNGGEDDEAAQDNILSIMLRVRDEQELECPFNNTNIKAIILDLFMAGTETIFVTIEWVMSELMRNPREMAKAQAEVREAFNNIIPHHHEYRMDRLHYTRMVIKETMRLHPTAALIPRLCRKSCDIGGYEVTKGSRVVINAWSMGRNPKYWDDAEVFRPTRFENNMVDYKGTDFRYLPFGGGRRICPGSGYAMATMEMIVARLLYYFDWSQPGKMLLEELNMETIVGLSAKRRYQLHLVATPYDVPKI